MLTLTYFVDLMKEHAGSLNANNLSYILKAKSRVKSKVFFYHFTSDEALDFLSLDSFTSSFLSSVFVFLEGATSVSLKNRHVLPYKRNPF